MNYYYLLYTHETLVSNVLFMFCGYTEIVNPIHFHWKKFFFFLENKLKLIFMV